MVGRPGRGGQNRRPQHDGRIDPANRPVASERLHGQALAIFHEIVAMAPHLTADDAALIERYCLAEVLRRQAQLDIDLNGAIKVDKYRGTMRSPALSVLRAAHQELSRTGAALMIDPLGRARLADRLASAPKSMTWSAFIALDPMAALMATATADDAPVWKTATRAQTFANVLAEHNTIIIEEERPARRPHSKPGKGASNDRPRSRGGQPPL